MNKFEFDHGSIFLGGRAPQDTAHLVVDAAAGSLSPRPQLANDRFVDMLDGQRPHWSKLLARPHLLFYRKFQLDEIDPTYHNRIAMRALERYPRRTTGD
jgi:hypothetical protein